MKPAMTADSNGSSGNSSARVSATDTATCTVPYTSDAAAATASAPTAARTGNGMRLVVCTNSRCATICATLGDGTYQPLTSGRQRFAAIRWRRGS